MHKLHKSAKSHLCAACESWLQNCASRCNSNLISLNWKIEKCWQLPRNNNALQNKRLRAFSRKTLALCALSALYGLLVLMAAFAVRQNTRQKKKNEINSRKVQCLGVSSSAFRVVWGLWVSGEHKVQDVLDSRCSSESFALHFSFPRSCSK